MQNRVVGLQTKPHKETNLDTRNKISIISLQKWNKPRQFQTAANNHTQTPQLTKVQRLF